MDLVSTLKIAMRALARNKMRSVLTMLGIIIGVGAVIAMVGIGQGADQSVQQQIAAMGSNMLFVSSGSMNRGGLRMGWGNTKTLVMDDVAAILKECPAVAAAAPGTRRSALAMTTGAHALPALHPIISRSATGRFKVAAALARKMYAWLPT